MGLSLQELLSESSKRFSPTGEPAVEGDPPETGIPEPLEPEDTMPALEEEPPPEVLQTEPVEIPTLEQLLEMRKGPPQGEIVLQKGPPEKPEMSGVELFEFNQKLINKRRKEHNAKLTQFVINKMFIGLRQFSLQYADTFSKNIDTFTTDPAAALLDATIKYSPIMQLIKPEEKKYFTGGGINLMTKEVYSFFGTPIPEDLPDNAWTAAAKEAATTGNLLSIIKRGAKITLKEPEIAVGKIAKVVRAGKLVTQFGKKIVKGFGESVIKSPKTIRIAETAGAVTAGIVGAKFEEEFPDHPITKFLAQTGSGSAVTLAIPRQVAAVAIGLKNMAVSSIGGRRAKQALQDRVAAGVEEDKQALIQRLEKVDEEGVPIVDKEGKTTAREEDLPELRGVSTPVQQSGSGLLARIYQAIIDQSSKMQHAQQVQFEQYNEALATAARNIGGDPSYTRQTLLLQQQELKRALVILVENAQQLVRNKVKTLLDDGIEMTLEEANLLGEKAVRGILKVARGQEADLYKVIDTNVLFHLATPHAQLQAILKKRATTSRPGDLPSYVTKAFGSWRKLTKDELKALKKKGLPAPPKKRIWEPGELKNKTNTLELTEIRSRMLEDARIAAAAGRSNKARILNLMAESVRHSYAETATKASKETAHKIKLANDFSKNVHDTFGRGKLAPLLAKSRKGGPKIDPEFFLDKALTTASGRKRASMLKSLHDDPAQFGDPGKLRAALENWIKGDFARRFTKDGVLLNEKDARAFMEANRETFEMYPKIADDLWEVIKTGDAATALISRVEDLGKRLGNPNISKTTLFIEKSPMEAFDSIRGIQDTRYNNVAKQISLLVNATKKDESGEALHGLQSAFFQYVMDLSSSGKRTINDLGVFTDGGKMKQLMNEPAIRDMMFKILNPKQRDTMRLIQEAASRLDISRRAKAAVEGVLGENAGPANLLRTFVRIAGAQTGAKIAKLTGSGTVQTPGFMAANFERFLRSKIKDPIALIINQAFMDDDPRILALLLKEIKSEDEMRKAALTIGVWFNSLVYNSGAKYFEEDEEQPIFKK